MPGCLRKQVRSGACSGDVGSGHKDMLAEDPHDENGDRQAVGRRVFTSHMQTKVARKGKTHVPARNATFDVHFFLVDEDGEEELAVVGENTGDSHYSYKVTPGFQQSGHCVAELEGRTRMEVVLWLEKIMRASQRPAGALDAPDDSKARTDTSLPSRDAAQPSPQFVKFIMKNQLLGGTAPRRLCRFFLVDDDGTEHLAAEGVERSSRDGHYVYSGMPEFVARYPLEACTRRLDLQKWLSRFVGWPRQPPAVQPGKEVEDAVMDAEDEDGGAADLGAEEASEGVAEEGDVQMLEPLVPDCLDMPREAAAGDRSDGGELDSWHAVQSCLMQMLKRTREDGTDVAQSERMVVQRHGSPPAAPASPAPGPMPVDGVSPLPAPAPAAGAGRPQASADTCHAADASASHAQQHAQVLGGGVGTAAASVELAAPSGATEKRDNAPHPFLSGGEDEQGAIVTVSIPARAEPVQMSDSHVDCLVDFVGCA